MSVFGVDSEKPVSILILGEKIKRTPVALTDQQQSIIRCSRNSHRKNTNRHESCGRIWESESRYNFSKTLGAFLKTKRPKSDDFAHSAKEAISSFNTQLYIIKTSDHMTTIQNLFHSFMVQKLSSPEQKNRPLIII